MISILAVAVAAWFALVAPVLLTTGDWAVSRPRLALAGWVGSLLGGAAALVVAVGAWLLPVPMWQRPGCAGCGATGAFLIGVAAAALLGGLAALVGGHAERVWATSRDNAPAVVLLAARAATRSVTRQGVRVSQVDGIGPIALSSRACGGQIVMGTALTRHLSASELDAVVAHETAHLTYHHDWVLLLARLNLACFPRLGGARAFAARVHLLVELVADDLAARSCGAADCAAALHKLAALSDDEGAALRALRLSARAGARVPQLS